MNWVFVGCREEGSAVLSWDDEHLLSCAGVDSIDDLHLVRSGGMKRLFGGVHAPSTVGTV